VPGLHAGGRLWQHAPMHIYNTLTRRMEPVEPLEPGHVRLYTCGPTVYNYAHIGNFRTYMFEDLLRRQLQASGFRVTQVMNLTDVDDKTIRGAIEAGISLEAFTAPFKQAFFDDIDVLGIERAEHYPAATAHIEAMVALIGTLMEKGYAYRSEDGSVYFSIARFPDYGKLAHLDMSGLQSGARVAQDEYDKENAADFALWKAWHEADGAIGWDAPWGRGRPGWHVECSAMSMAYLGESFDIHTGGVDNLFPHHEDEIAQSECATGKPFVRYWMHAAHLVVDGQKMSKSLGNFYTLRDLLDRGYAGREVRYALLGAHYRQALNFTLDALDAARKALRRVDDFTARLREADTAGAAVPDWAIEALQRFESAMSDDLNVPVALAALFDLVHTGNRALDATPVPDWSTAGVLRLIDRMDRVLGVLSPAAEDGGDARVEALLAERAAARAARDWATADRLRDTLRELGWEVRDSPDGQKVKRL